MKEIKKAEQQMMKYFKAHPSYNSFVHTFIGVGVGILISYSFFGQQFMSWGWVLLAIGILAHIYPLFAE